MYGTVLIATVKPGQQQAYLAATQKWLAQRAPVVAGFGSAWVMLGDDGRTVVAGAQFASADDYRKLGNDAEQDRFWREHFAPLLDGEPRWEDGTWANLPATP